MRFLVDAQLPPALARWLGDRGVAATAVRDLGLRDSDDGSIWNFAIRGGWTVITKDEDFVARCVGNPPLHLSCGCASAIAQTLCSLLGSNLYFQKSRCG
jgi:predicted nuclease of predicted toxin-antitoxin system